MWPSGHFFFARNVFNFPSIMEISTMHDITNIYQHKPTVAYHWSDYLGAVVFAICIGVPFAIYFWRM